MLVDAHVHCSDLADVEAYGLSGNFVFVCVSEDLRTSSSIVELSKRYHGLEPCIGVHPWFAHEYSPQEITSILNEFIVNKDVRCLGEVGLDRRFRSDTFKKQLEVFSIFVEYARNYDLVLNLHAADAWIDVFELIYRKSVNRAYFHWYTGSVELLQQIESVGYYVGINPAWKIQQKHRNVAEKANLANILTESDAPYNYRGLVMTPALVEDTIKYLSEVKRLDVNIVKERVYNNYKTLFKKS